MSIYLIRFIFLIVTVTVLASCGGGSSSSSPVLVNQPSLPTPPISSIDLGDDFTGFIIGTQPLSVDPSSANSLHFTQQLYELGSDNSITPVTMFDIEGVQIDFTGNLSYTDVENIIPLDIMILNSDYLLLSVFHRNFDTDEDNDYFNLLIDLHDGSITSAPVGLNKEGNSGRSFLTTPGRDVFPPDARWNLSDNLYIISVDYEELGLMESEDYEPSSGPEIVDHYTDVPCPTSTTDESTDTESTTTEEVTEETSTAGSSCTNTTTVSTDTETSTDTNSESITGVNSNSKQLLTPTALYRMDLQENNQFTLVKVSAEDDRPGLGQLIISDNGTIIYRNEDGGDNSYRVLLPNCEGVTGRLSTVLLAPYSTLITAPDESGVNSVFEVTYAGMNKLKFSCNGNIERIAHTSYSTQITSLKLPSNSPIISSYDYAYPYLINTRCQSVDLFPTQTRFSTVLDPMPAIPGLYNGDPRGLRKSQYLNDHLICIGYDSSLQLSVATLDPNDYDPQFDFLNLDFGLWLPSFNTIHMVTDNIVMFTGTSRSSPAVKTIMLDSVGTETDLTETLGGFEVRQQIEISPPGVEYSLPAAN